MYHASWRFARHVPCWKCVYFSISSTWDIALTHLRWKDLGIWVHGSNLLYPGLSWSNPSSSMFDMPRHNTHHAETCRRISLAHLENCSYCSYLLMSIMSHRKTFTWLVLSHRITFFGWLVAAMFCWQPSHQSKQHPIYPNRSIQNTSDTNSACCCAGWSW